ncbi:DUF4283 domain-containing protein [Raphanus sativus]|nr:DUF4283 domain-containing protein [Raphanus sativus]
MFVRVDLTKKLPTNIISGFSNGREVDISVSYPWLPLKCESCGKYGHLRNKCKMTLMGQHKERKRSVSPSTEASKQRHKSRQGRQKHVNVVPPTSKVAGRTADIVPDKDAGKALAAPTHLEEGEIAQEGSSDGYTGEVKSSCASGKYQLNFLGTKAVGEVKVGGPSVSDGNAGVENDVSVGKSDNASSGLDASRGTDDSSGSAGDDNPFFLAQGRRCGRKVTKSQ